MKSLPAFRPLLALALASLFVAHLPLHAQRGPAPAPLLVAEPVRATGIYATGEKVSWTIAPAPGATLPAGDFTYTVKTNNAATIKSGSFDFASGKTATIDVVQNEPAMLYVQITPPAPAPAPATAAPEGNAAPPAAARGGGRGRGGRGGGGFRVAAAVSPEKIPPAVPRPADFDAFWDGKLAELAKIPINPALTSVPANKDGIELFTVKLDSVGSNVQGYLAKPARPGKFPALIMYQWAGVYSLETQTLASVKDRAAEGWLVFNVNSHDIAVSEAQAQHPELANYQALGNTNRETSYFLRMYLRDARAVDYIKTRTDWDGKTIVFQGTSMGGQQSLATAALRPDDVDAVIINVPSGADSNGNLHGRTAGYPNWPSNNPEIMNTALYFDTVNFASRIKAPVVAAIGFLDTTSPPVGIFAALNQIPGRKEAISMVESDHNHITPEKQGAWNERSKEVRDSLLKTGTFKVVEPFAKP
jgi:cephalosporin-C deacetylase